MPSFLFLGNASSRPEATPIIDFFLELEYKLTSGLSV
jgi:hypothetical protein